MSILKFICQPFAKLFVSRSYIHYLNSNPMWNRGIVMAVINGQIVESVSVDDSGMSADELIDEMKLKYKLNKVRYDEAKSQK